jgi:hypothetical protein
MEEKTQDDMEELILINHELDQTEHKTILHSLKSFMGTLMSPIGSLPAVAVKSLKRQRDITANLISSLTSFNKELAITDSELNILKKALKNFASAPINNLKSATDLQVTAISLLKEFEIYEDEI